MQLITSKLTHKKFDPCFIVGDQKFYSRYYALKHAHNIAQGKNINERHLVKFDTGIDHRGLEPQCSAAELWQQRARQLRRDYEYVRIWASGGADSTNVLYSFYHAGVEPDEIAVYLQYPGLVQPFQNIEVDYSLRPLLPEIQQWWPNVKIQFYPILPEHYYWYSKNAVEHWVAYTQLHPNALSWQIPYEVYPELQDHSLKYKTANIYGGPDISVGIDDKGWYYTYICKSFNDAHNAPYQEHFYFDPSSSDLTLKTVYAAKRHLQQRFENSKPPYGEWRVYLSEVKELDFVYPALREFGDKEFKQPWHGNGILASNNPKGAIRMQNMLSTVIGQTSLLNFIGFLKEVNDDHPNWFHNGNVIENWIGFKGSKIYWENI